MKLIIDISEGSYNTIKECYERGELLTTICMQIATGTPYEERPQGEWNYIQADMCVCPFCGAIPHKLYKNYCAKCGADMRKGSEECMDEDARQASIPYTYNAPQYDWKCGYPDITRGKEE